MAYRNNTKSTQVFACCVLTVTALLHHTSAFTNSLPPRTTVAKSFLMSSSSPISDTSTSLYSSSTQTNMKYINSVKDTLDLNNYSTYLLDMWGVMHDGTKPYEGVIDTVQKLKENNKKMIILSNSSKRKDNAIRTLTRLGFDPENDFERIITSGDVSYRMLSADETLECETWSVISNLLKNEDKMNKVFVYGSGDGDEEYITSTGKWIVSSIDEADMIIARGTFTINDGTGEESIISKHDDEDAYNKALEETLQMAASRQLPMLVTNPDKVRPDVGLPPMPGAIGDRYEEILMAHGKEKEEASAFVKRIGKPYPEVYELALLGKIDPKSAVMVGDALETDVTGGTRAACDTLWVVMDGIHSEAIDGMEGTFEENTEGVLNGFNEKQQNTDGNELRPTFVTKHFQW